MMTTYNNDKMIHFILTMIPAFAGYMVAVLASVLWPEVGAFRKAAGMGMAGLIAYWKEYWDMRHPLAHTSDGLDFVSGMAGATVLIACLP